MLEENLNFPGIIYQTFSVACKGFFVMSDIAFEFDNPTYNFSVIQKLSLLTQFLGKVSIIVFVPFFFFPRRKHSFYFNMCGVRR